MKKLIFLATIFIVPALSQDGWHQLSNTTIAVGSGTSICVPDHFNNGLVTGFGTWPDVLYYSGGGSSGYGFRGCTDQFDRGYNGGVVDTKRSRLLIQGGGHNGQPNNAFMSLDLATISQTTATCGGTGSCNVTSNQGGSPKTPSTIVPGTVLTGGAGSWTRLNDPSFPPGCGATIGVDNSSVSLQSYQGLVYLPKHDMVFYKGAANCAAAGTIPYAWLIDMTKLGVPAAGTPWIQATNGAYNDSGSGYYCDNYPNSINPSSSDAAPTHEKIVCMAGQYLFIVDIDEALASIYPFHLLTSLSIPDYGGGSVLKVDPKRRVVFISGTSIFPNPGTGIYMYEILLDPPYTQTPILVKNDGNNPLTGGYYELVQGCDNFAGYSGSGMAYDPTIDRFVTYSPRTVLSTSVSTYGVSASTITVTNLTGAAPMSGQTIFATNISNPSSGNTTISNVVNLGGGSYRFDISPVSSGGATNALVMLVSSTASNAISIFDPATMTCVNQPLLGSSSPSSAVLNATDGTWGHFSYVPNLNEYVLWNNSGTNAFTFTLNTDASNGRGASTLTCVDEDGDGYGVGPGCTGPDADDRDANVHTSAQFLSKWSTLQLGLNHLGYNPANIWYVSPTGTDTGSPAACKNTIGSPCATPGYIFANGFAAGDAIVMRGGTYTANAQMFSGSSGLPVMILAYPGELPIFSGAPSGFDMRQDQVFVVIDGVNFHSSGGNACIQTVGGQNIIWTHMYNDSCEWNFSGEGNSAPDQPMVDVTVSDSMGSTTLSCGSGVQHGLYFTFHGESLAQNIFIRRNIMHDNCYTGIQLSGKTTNAIIEQNLTYNNTQPAGISLNEGVSNSIIQNNVDINSDEGMVLFTYNGSEGQPNCGTGLNLPCTCTSSGQAQIYNSICPFSMNYNLITNNTAYLTGTDATGSPDNQAPGIYLSANQTGGGCTTVGCTSVNIWYNTLQNNIASVNNGAVAAGGYGAFQFDKQVGGLGIPLNLPKTNMANNLGFDLNGVGYTASWEFGSSFGMQPLTCTGASNSLASTALSSTGCVNADPKFVSTCTYTTLSSCNLNLQLSSPATGAGVIPINYTYDNIGTPLSFSAPSIGALQPTTAPCVITPNSLGPWTVGQVINQTFMNSGCSSSSWAVSSGSFPTGLTFNTTTGVLAGTITSATGSPFTPTITYSTASNTYNIVVNVAPSVTTCGGNAAPNCPSGTVSVTYLTSGSAPVVLATTGGTGTVTCAVTSGSLPNNLSLSGCTISGSPSLAGTFNFNITPTDANAISGTAVAYSIVIGGGAGTPQTSIVGAGTLGTGIKH